MNTMDMAPRMCIIGGCGRSGTTLLLAILSAHPEIEAVPRETNAFCNNSAPYVPEPFRLDGNRIKEPWNNAIENEKILCEKTPKNVHAFGKLIETYGDKVKCINIIRDGRDVVCSIMPWANEYWVKPERWVEDVRKGLGYISNPQVLKISYEGLVSNPKSVMETVITFLDLEWHENLDDWTKHTVIKTTPGWHGKGEVREINEGSVGRHKLPEQAERLKLLMDYPGAKELLEELGHT